MTTPTFCQWRTCSASSLPRCRRHVHHGRGASQPASRITQPIDNRVPVSLKGNVHPLAQARYDLGPVADSFPAERMLLLLQRSPERESALQRFLQEAHRPGSPNYHHWLTPEQFAGDYGPADSEIAAVRGWLERQGFSVERVTRGRTAIEFSGTPDRFVPLFTPRFTAMRSKARSTTPTTSIRKCRRARAVIAGITPINDFQPTPYVKVLGKAVYDRATRKFVPQWTFPEYNDLFELSPGDFALQYD